jgi:phosphatidylethanolamine/phosphatidyl-N-methylethanolamine N-methyltransferase
MSQRTDLEDKAFIETDRYIYANPVTRWLTNRGHSACARIREFDTTGGLVMDLGCGTGTHFSYIRSAQIVGLDAMSEMLARAKGNIHNRGSLVQGDILHLPFIDSSVVSMVSFGVLEHLRQLEKALAEIRRVLSDDGEFIFGIPCEGFLYRLGRELTTKRHVQKETGVDYNELLAKEHVNQSRDILKALRNTFTIQKLVGVPFYLPSIELNALIVGRCTKKG